MSSLSFLHSVVLSSSSQSLLYSKPSSSLVSVPITHFLTSSPPPPPSTLTVQAKARTRRQDRQARHVRIRKKIYPRTNRHRMNITRAELQTSTTTTSELSDSYSLSSSSQLHKVTVHDRQRGVSHEFLVPEDQYILHTAEAQNISLPFACRHGCCTSCAVRIKSGEIRQPEALGISAELRAKGYALLCVGFPTCDVEVETQDEDEVYWLQFGRYFARGPIERDDYALELAMGDE